jgi:hypothetical protein
MTYQWDLSFDDACASQHIHPNVLVYLSPFTPDGCLPGMSVSLKNVQKGLFGAQHPPIVPRTTWTT